MATIDTYTKKNGKISYNIQIKVKDPITEKVKTKSTTWHNPDNLTGVRLERALNKFVFQWEEEVKNKKTTELSEFTFTQMANSWLEIIEQSKSRNHYLKASRIIQKFNEYFGQIKFNKITAYMVSQFFVGLNNTTFSTSTAIIKPQMALSLQELENQVGINKVTAEGDFSKPTLYYARLGKPILWKSAVAICKRFNISVNEYFDKVVAEKQYKNETKLEYQRVLSAIFNYAIQYEVVTKNFASKIYLKNHFKDEVKEYKILSKDELNRLLDTLANHDIFDTLPIYLLTLSGLRTCEVCGLNWNDIDFEHKIINVQRDRIYVPKEGIIKSVTKTKYSKRDIPICDILFEALKKAKTKWNTLKDNDPDFSDSGAVYYNIKGEPGFPHTINSHLKKYLAESNCPIVSNHKLRHGWITELISNNVPANVVAKLAGHVNAETTLKIYSHYAKHADNSIDALNEIFCHKSA